MSVCSVSGAALPSRRAELIALCLFADPDDAAVDLATQAEEETAPEYNPDFVLGRCEAVAEDLRQLLGPDRSAHGSVNPASIQ